MKKFQLNIVVLTTILIVMGLIYACDEPPVEPEPDPVMGCKVEGDIIINYTSAKGNLSGFTIENRYQFYFSSFKSINGKKYGLVVSLFPEIPSDTSGYFPIVAQDNAPDSGNYAIASFFEELETTNEIIFWATSGEFHLDFVSIANPTNKIIGTFSFKAIDPATKLKQITVTDGWVNLEKQY